MDYLVEYHGEGLPEHAPSGPCKAPNMFCGYVGPEMNNHPPEWNRDPVCSCQDSHNNTFACVRTFEPFEGGRDWTYCEFFTAEGQEYYREFYNVTRDVWQRTNEVGPKCRAGDMAQGTLGCVALRRSRITLILFFFFSFSLAHPTPPTRSTTLIRPSSRLSTSAWRSCARARALPAAPSPRARQRFGFNLLARPLNKVQCTLCNTCLSSAASRFRAATSGHTHIHTLGRNKKGIAAA